MREILHSLAASSAINAALRQTAGVVTKSVTAAWSIPWAVRTIMRQRQGVADRAADTLLALDLALAETGAVADAVTRVCQRVHPHIDQMLPAPPFPTTRPHSSYLLDDAAREEMELAELGFFPVDNDEVNSNSVAEDSHWAAALVTEMMEGDGVDGADLLKILTAGVVSLGGVPNPRWLIEW